MRRPAPAYARTQEDEMNDVEFLVAFEAGTLESFRHRDHIRMCWLYLRRHGPEKGAPAVTEGIKRFAVVKGATGLFHETLTRAWLRLVEAALRQTPAGDFDAFVARHPQLADKETVYRHYRRETIAGAPARARWVEPDLAPLP
jgi:hypothetical protein